MYINFWYPVVQSTKLEDKPQKIRMLGQDFVVFRDTQGNAHCLADTCVHRGGSLAKGKINGDCIQCPYHGWEFNGAGECQRIPSLGPNPKIPGRTRTDAYPVEEKYGLVFAFLGDLAPEDRPPMIEMPEFGKEGWRATWTEFETTFNYERSIENGLDPAHNEFVHPTHGFSGANEEYRVNELRWLGDPVWGEGFFHKFNSPEADDSEWAKMKKASSDREVGSGHIGPNQIWTYIRYGEGRAMHQYLYEAPIDATHTRIWLVNMRNSFLEPELDDKVNARNWKVVSQDIGVLENLHPKLTPLNNTREFMVPADEPILRYRDKLRNWDAMGWRIDNDALESSEGKIAFAIPSPGRREHKSWVLDPIPLVPGKPEEVRKSQAG